MKWANIKEAVGKLAPTAGALLGGPAGGAIGGLLASALGVDASPDSVAQALRVDPDAAIKLRTLELNHKEQMERLHLQSESARLETVNKTMRTEAQANDAYVRRWRPTFGYAVALTWVFQSLSIAYALIASPSNAADIINAVVALTPMWGIALAVLGINVSKRSADKQVAAGLQPTGLLGLLRSDRPNEKGTPNGGTPYG